MHVATSPYIFHGRDEWNCDSTHGLRLDDPIVRFVHHLWFVHVSGSWFVWHHLRHRHPEFVIRVVHHRRYMLPTFLSYGGNHGHTHIPFRLCGPNHVYMLPTFRFIQMNRSSMFFIIRLYSMNRRYMYFTSHCVRRELHVHFSHV